MFTICKLKSGDKDTFKELFELYNKPLYNYIYAKTDSAYKAEEIVQITFIKVWNYRKSFKEEIPISIQLFRIAKGVLIDQIRKAHSQLKYESYLLNQSSSDNVSTYSMIHYKETLDKLNKLLKNLPPKCKRVFEMSRFSSLSYKDIAKELSLSEKTVENHINHALKFLKPFFSILLIQIFH